MQGHCPMGCGTTLFLGEGLLEDAEAEHVVTFEASTFTVRHPLRERIGGQLEDCDLHRYVAALPGPPVRPGRYRARAQPTGDWSWETAR